MQKKILSVVLVLALVLVFVVVIWWVYKNFFTDDPLAFFTFVLAIATVGLTWETWRGRKEQEQHRKEIAFRAALIEAANNIANFTRWNPILTYLPDKEWLNQSLSFAKLTEMLETVWVDPRLWERITGGLLINLKRFEERIHSNLLSETAEERVKIECSKRDYFLIDIYLKQLACYILSEMQRQGIKVPEDIQRTQIFWPLAWNYGGNDESPQMIAYTLECQLVPPFVSLPPEPEDAAFSDCRLELLISKARQAHQRQLETLVHSN